MNSACRTKTPSMASPSRTWAGAVLGRLAGALIRILSFSLTGVMNIVLQLRLWNAANRGLRRVLRGCHFLGHVVSVPQVRPVCW